MELLDIAARTPEDVWMNLKGPEWPQRSPVMTAYRRKFRAAVSDWAAVASLGSP